VLHSLSVTAEIHFYTFYVVEVIKYQI